MPSLLERIVRAHKNGNGGAAPAFVPITGQPMVTCAPGWTGPDCKTKIANGAATAFIPAGPPRVTCAPGWTGPDCKTRIADVGTAFAPAGAPFVTCAPGWTGPDCKTRIGDNGLPTGVQRLPGGTITRFHVAEDEPRYEMQNGVPVRVKETAPVEKGFLIGPIAIAAAVTIGLIALLRDGAGN